MTIRRKLSWLRGAIMLTASLLVLALQTSPACAMRRPVAPVPLRIGLDTSPPEGATVFSEEEPGTTAICVQTYHQDRDGTLSYPVRCLTLGDLRGLVFADLER